MQSVPSHNARHSDFKTLRSQAKPDLVRPLFTWPKLRIAPQVILMCLNFEKHSPVHFSSRYLHDAFSYFISISTQMLPLQKGSPDSLI